MELLNSTIVDIRARIAARTKVKNSIQNGAHCVLVLYFENNMLCYCRCLIDQDRTKCLVALWFAAFAACDVSAVFFFSNLVE